ncbi:MAG: S8 family serine peptidase [Paracoccaceae bacterium]
MPKTFLRALLLGSICLPLVTLGPQPGDWPGGMAQAQEGGGGGSDDGNGGGSDDGPGATRGGAGERDRARRVRRAVVAAPPPPPPVAAPDEIVVTDLAPEALVQLQAEGFSLIEEVALSLADLRLARLRVPPALGLEAARARVRGLPGGEDADFNHFYRPEQGAAQAATAGWAAETIPETIPAAAAAAACAHENCGAFTLIGWPAERGETCRVTVPVGVIDTGVNAAHEILAGARMEVIRLTPEGADASQAVHGTAVASLLVGAEGSRVPGLIPEAEIIAVDVFSDIRGDERADVPSLLRGLELLAGRGVGVMNLSLAGPENRVLTVALDALTGPGDAAEAMAGETGKTGPLIVAAAGNGGPEAAPAWPAAHPGVLAVTAVDGRGRIYRAAQRGDHVDLAAPGVGLLAATSIRGARGKTGTSYAVPFVTAAAAVMLSRDPGLGPRGVAAALSDTARDLGAEGRDPIFGAGLLDTTALCGAGAATE